MTYDIAFLLSELCAVMTDNGTRQSNGSTVIKFGELFDIYTYISNKLVGVLLRARKHGLVTFEGETLFQRRDDNVDVVLLYTMDKVEEMCKEANKDDFEWGKCM